MRLVAGARREAREMRLVAEHAEVERLVQDESQALDPLDIMNPGKIIASD